MEVAMKINWNATLDLKNKKMGAGVVIRDEEGEVLASLCMSKPQVTSPIIAETTTLWRAVKLCAELKIDKVLLEGDALGSLRQLTV